MQRMHGEAGVRWGVEGGGWGEESGRPIRRLLWRSRRKLEKRLAGEGSAGKHDMPWLLAAKTGP